MSFFDECVAQQLLLGDDIDYPKSSFNQTVADVDSLLVLQCVTSKIDAARGLAIEDRNLWVLVLAGSLVFLMQTGFAMLCAGYVRKKNVQNTLLKNLLDVCGAAIAWYCVGYAISFGGQRFRTDTTFIGTTDFFSNNADSIDYAFWWFQFAISSTAATVVASSLAERCRMAAYLFCSIFMTGFVYPVVAHGVWSQNGFLSAFNADPLWGVGVIDVSGSAVVHITGGITALVAVVVLGPRNGRFTDNGNGKKKFMGHSTALQLVGTMTLWFGCKSRTGNNLIFCVLSRTHYNDNSYIRVWI
jgi:ammonium transporter, Amt family